MKCPICGKSTVKETRPFCSKRCADLDLARWFNGSYAVPSNDPEDLDALEDLAADAEELGKTRKPH